MSGPARSPTIPIPIPSNPSNNPSHNVRTALDTAIPITPGIRPRRPSTHRMSFISPSDHRSTPQSIRSTTGLASSPPTTTPSRSFTRSSTFLTLPNSRATPTYEPRIIRAHPAPNTDVQCSPSTSVSPSRPRRASAATARLSTMPGPSLGLVDRQPPHPAPPFPRPAYLEHSALRHLLLTESNPTLPPLRPKPDPNNLDHQLATARRRTSMSPSTDSDGESDRHGSPPRETPPAPPPAVLYDPVLRLPTRWSEQVRHPLLTVSGDGRDLTYHGPSSSGDKDAAAARTSHCIPPACGIYYYEVLIVSKGQKGHISIGFAARDVRLSRLPGWEKNSWGYHGDDGYSFAAEKNGTPYGPTYGTGDVIGCGIDFSQHKVFYTKNGTFLGPTFENVGKDCDIFPSVGLRHSGEAIRVNFGHDPFQFDIEYHVQQQRNYTWAKIQSTSLDKLFASATPTSAGNKGGDKSATITTMTTTTTTTATATTTPHDRVSDERVRKPINRLVLEYLAHHGYARTARAFKAQCDRRRGLDADAKSLSTSSTAAMTDSDREDVNMNDAGSRRGFGWGGDIDVRTRIVGAVISGDVDTALKETEERYSGVLEQEGGLMRIKLRCRKFVEMVLAAGEMEKGGRAETEDEVVLVGEDEEDEEEEERMVMIGVGADGNGMDVDDDAPMSSSSSSSVRMAGTNGYVAVRGPGDESALSLSFSSSSVGGPVWHGGVSGSSVEEDLLLKALAYGRSLDAEYKTDMRPEVRSICERTFSILACKDLGAASGAVAEVVGHEARIGLANELNQAILKSQGRPERPALEMLYRQTAACVIQLGLSGVGAAAFADMHKEFLDG